MPRENEDFLLMEVICPGTGRRSGVPDPMQRLHPDNLPFTYGYVL